MTQASFEAIEQDTDKLEDFDIYVMACGMVAIAGKRATLTKNRAVEAICIRFVRAMAEAVGTPSFPPKEPPK